MILKKERDISEIEKKHQILGNHTNKTQEVSHINSINIARKQVLVSLILVGW